MDFVRNPIEALLHSPASGVLAVIIRVEGPSYRPVGAMMGILPNGERIGSLSSGCIEADLVLHAKIALQSGHPIKVIYGQGSPFLDIQLPCGGGLEILLLPNPTITALEKLCDFRRQRLPCSAHFNAKTGEFKWGEACKTSFQNDILVVSLVPDINFFIFGKGPEASTFAALVHSAKYENLLLSPDEETLATARQLKGPTRHLISPEFPVDLSPDQWSAIVLFFHDHEWEPEIVMGALKTDAFYIGAQGSRRARDNRVDNLKLLGVSEAAIERVKGPIGLVPSTRDARSLAVSVLAEILS